MFIKDFEVSLDVFAVNCEKVGENIEQPKGDVIVIVLGSSHNHDIREH